MFEFHKGKCHHKLGKRICAESETNQTVYAVESVAVSSLARRQLALLRVFHARTNLTEHALLGFISAL